MVKTFNLLGSRLKSFSPQPQPQESSASARGRRSVACHLVASDWEPRVSGTTGMPLFSGGFAYWVRCCCLLLISLDLCTKLFACGEGDSGQWVGYWSVSE
jgi:hypothetical protein